MSDPSTSKKPGVHLNQVLEAAGLEPVTYQYMGLPWRGKAQWIDKSREDMKPVRDTRVHMTIIDTRKKEDRDMYEAINTLASRMAAVPLGEDKQAVRDKDGVGWLILLRWMEVFFRSPDAYETYWQRIEE